MSLADPNHPLAQLLKHDLRYKLDAYLFVLESLQFAQDSLGMGEEPSAEDIEPLRAGAFEAFLSASHVTSYISLVMIVIAAINNKQQLLAFGGRPC